jgi:hypothetical protein
MNVKVRKIEVDVETADLLEARAAARGMSVAELLADIACNDEVLPADLGEMRARGEGPWLPEVLEEDARRLAEFERIRLGCPGRRSRPGWRAGALEASFQRLSRASCES